MARTTSRLFLAALVLGVTAAPSSAQTTTTSTQTKKFEVIAVDGNNVVAKLPEGTREITVPDGFQFDVDGQKVTVAQLKPGMHGTATITTRTTVTPVTVTEIKNGTIMQQNGGSILVRTDQGFKMFTQGDVDKRGVKILRDGQPAQISEFREGDRLTATIITTKPPKIMTERQVNASLARPAATTGTPGTTPPATAAAPAGAPAPAARPTLPKTASAWPAFGLASLLALACGLALTVRRRALN